jgi:hypothetical protein
VQVTLDPAARGVGAFDQAGARRAKLLNAGSQLRIESLVLPGEGGGAADRAQELALLAHRRRVDEHRHRLTVVLQRRAPAVPVLAREREVDALGVHPFPAFRQPVRHPQRRVAECVGERVAQRSVRTTGTETRDELVHRGSGGAAATKEPARNANGTMASARGRDGVERLLRRSTPSASCISGTRRDPSRPRARARAATRSCGW